MEEEPVVDQALIDDLTKQYFLLVDEANLCRNLMIDAEEYFLYYQSRMKKHNPINKDGLRREVFLKGMDAKANEMIIHHERAYNTALQEASKIRKMLGKMFTRVPYLERLITDRIAKSPPPPPKIRAAKNLKTRRLQWKPPPRSQLARTPPRISPLKLSPHFTPNNPSPRASQLKSSPITSSMKLSPRFTAKNPSPRTSPMNPSNSLSPLKPMPPWSPLPIKSTPSVRPLLKLIPRASPVKPMSPVVSPKMARSLPKTPSPRQRTPTREVLHQSQPRSPLRNVVETPEKLQRLQAEATYVNKLRETRDNKEIMKRAIGELDSCVYLVKTVASQRVVKRFNIAAKKYSELIKAAKAVRDVLQENGRELNELISILMQLGVPTIVPDDVLTESSNITPRPTRSIELSEENLLSQYEEASERWTAAKNVALNDPRYFLALNNLLQLGKKIVLLETYKMKRQTPPNNFFGMIEVEMPVLAETGNIIARENLVEQVEIVENLAEAKDEVNSRLQEAVNLLVSLGQQQSATRETVQQIARLREEVKEDEQEYNEIQAALNNALEDFLKQYRDLENVTNKMLSQKQRLTFKPKARARKPAQMQIPKVKPHLHVPHFSPISESAKKKVFDLSGDRRQLFLELGRNYTDLELKQAQRQNISRDPDPFYDEEIQAEKDEIESKLERLRVINGDLLYIHNTTDLRPTSQESAVENFRNLIEHNTLLNMGIARCLTDLENYEASKLQADIDQVPLIEQEIELKKDKYSAKVGELNRVNDCINRLATIVINQEVPVEFSDEFKDAIELTLDELMIRNYKPPVEKTKTAPKVASVPVPPRRFKHGADDGGIEDQEKYIRANPEKFRIQHLRDHAAAAELIKKLRAERKLKRRR